MFLVLYTKCKNFQLHDITFTVIIESIDPKTSKIKKYTF